MTAVGMEQAHTPASFENLESPNRQVVAAEGKSRRFRLIVTAVALLGVVCVAVGAVLVFHQKSHNSSVTLLAAAQATPVL
ncbi:unnamed protein product, partial [Aphanomyces euteiches]